MVSCLPSGWVPSVTAQAVLQQQTPTSAELQAWTNRVQAVENVRSAEPAYASTRISLKGPTASMTRPSVKGTEASSATVSQAGSLLLPTYFFC